MGANFLRFSVQVAEYLSGRNLNMVFSSFILRYVESKFTLLTYLMGNNTVMRFSTTDVINYYIITPQWHKCIKSRVFNLTEGS